MTPRWCEDIATLRVSQHVCAGTEHAGPAKQSIMSSGTMPRMPCPDARCWRVPSKLVEALLSSSARDEPLLFLSFPPGTGQARRPGPGPHTQAGSFHPQRNRLRIMLAHQYRDVTWPAVVGGYQPTCTIPAPLLAKRPYPAHAQVSRTGSPVSHLSPLTLREAGMTLWVD